MTTQQLQQLERQTWDAIRYAISRPATTDDQVKDMRDRLDAINHAIYAAGSELERVSK
ncbi:hypothetical protein AB1P65_09345 [Roseibium alexandrii]